MEKIKITKKKKINQPNQKTSIRHEKDIQMASKYVKGCLRSEFPGSPAG